MMELKMKMLEVIKNDEEIQQSHQEWKEKFSEPFPPWNYDCFGGIDDYKRRITCVLETGNTKKICESCPRKVCKQKTFLRGN